MKKFFLFMGCACATLVLVLTNNHVSLSSGISLPDVESLTACESIGWKDNDGNCVKNNKGEYFCKTDTMFEITDCIM